jgi:hypothetical protein
MRPLFEAVGSTIRAFSFLNAPGSTAAMMARYSLGTRMTNSKRPATYVSWGELGGGINFSVKSLETPTTPARIPAFALSKFSHHIERIADLIAFILPINNFLE